MSQLTPDEISSCVGLLKKLEPGFLPVEIFSQIARLVRLPIFILIPIKNEKKSLEIGMVKRGLEEKWWPGKWNLAGTIIRSTDTTATALNRLLKEELKVQSSDQPIFRNFEIHSSQRGTEALFIFSVSNCTFKDEQNSQWFKVDNLPPDSIPSEKKVIEKMIEALNG